MTQLIPPAKITEELEKIWDSLQGSNKMRACLFNLIIYTNKDSRCDYLHSVAQNVIQRFPSRVIFITEDETSDKNELTASVSVMTANEGDNAIACDLINIDVSGDHTVRVPFVTLPHILPDLPVYLVYAKDPSKKNSLLNELEKFASRIIYDSETTNSLPSYADALLKNENKVDAETADLNWGRIEDWRELLSEIFQPSDDLELLRNADSIHIHYNNIESKALSHTRMQSIYLQGWLACQLGWEYKKLVNESAATKFYYEFKGEPITVTLHPKEMKSIKPGRIISLEINSKDETKFSIARKLECPHHVQIERTTPETCSLPIDYIFETEESGKSLVKEICHKGTSNHFINLLKLLLKVKDGEFC